MEIIKKLRKAKGMTQKELANELDIAESTISKWEGGRAEPGIRELDALSKLFGVTIDELIKGVKDESKIPGSSKISISKLSGTEKSLYTNDILYSGFEPNVFYIHNKSIRLFGKFFVTTNVIASIIFLVIGILVGVSWFEASHDHWLGTNYWMLFIPLCFGIFSAIGLMIEGYFKAKKLMTKGHAENATITLKKSKIILRENATRKEMIYKWSSVINVHQDKKLANKQKTAVSWWGIALTDGGINMVNEVHEEHGSILLEFSDGEQLLVMDSSAQTYSMFQTLLRKY